ncbi:MAG TPA: hypothetical protein VFP87_02985 [Chitinophagaceae bacterium]|nr:hypothetical protein [Chitinophagaceae bacterium]
MKKDKKLPLTIVVLVLVVSNVFSQQNKNDSLFAFREFSRLQKMYQHLPVQINLHIQNSASPLTTPQDTLQTEMSIYFGTAGFYMEAEGLEEIVNDSLIVMVNNPSKQISVYRNDKSVMKRIYESLSMVLPDSSLQEFTHRYQSLVQDLDGAIRKIALNSRVTLYGTGKPKEIMTVTYQKTSYKPIEVTQTKLRLLPIDSSIYAGLLNDKTYDDKLLSAATSKGQIFFLVKEQKTSYRFLRIDYNVQIPPAKQQDRIAVAEDGSYLPSKGYEDYQVSTEF